MQLLARRDTVTHLHIDPTLIKVITLNKTVVVEDLQVID